jgi:hypothetical protein
VLLLACGFGFWNTAAASGERYRIKELMASVPDFFAAVEDGSNRVELLTETLASVPRPEYPQNRRLWLKSMLHVNALLAIEASRGGRWELSRVYERQTRGFLNQLNEPDLLSLCTAEYAECRRRHEQALSKSVRDKPRLVSNVKQLNTFIESLPKPQSPAQRVAVARLMQLAGISGYKGGDGAYYESFREARELLNTVPANRRSEAWVTTYARLAADESLRFVGRREFDRSREILDSGIQILHGADKPYLQGLLNANRADVSRYEWSSSEEPRKETLSAEISDRFTAMAELQRPLVNGGSLNQSENDTLNRARLVQALAAADRWPEAFEQLKFLEGRVSDVISFENPQVNPLLRATLGMAIACDETRTTSERKISWLRAMEILSGQQIHDWNKSQRSFTVRLCSPFLSQLPSDARVELEESLDRIRGRSE